MASYLYSLDYKVTNNCETNSIKIVNLPIHKKTIIN
jgi:hypothetical protein